MNSLGNITFNFPTTLSGAIIYFIGLLLLWVVISVPVYFAGKLITGRKSDFGDAMGATLGGAISYFVVLFGVTYFLGAVIGNPAGALAIILALLAWLAVYRAAFRTGWAKALGIVVLSWVILLALDAIMVHAFGVQFPDFFPFA